MTRDHRPQLPLEVLETVYEEWLAHPNRVQYQPYTEHQAMAYQQGWFCSGRRGFGQTMQPLPAELDARLAERELARG